MGRKAKFRKALSMPSLLAQMRRCFEGVEDEVAGRGLIPHRRLRSPKAKEVYWQPPRYRHSGAGLVGVVDDRVRAALLLGQLGLNARRPVDPAPAEGSGGPPAVRVNRPHTSGEYFVAALSRRTPSLTPRIEPARAWGGSGHSGHRGYPQLGLIRSHEPIDLPGPTSRANQAAAFASICLPSADNKTAIPVLHAAGGSHDAADASPRALRCSVHHHAGLRHGRNARPSCGSPGPWVRTVYLRQTTKPPCSGQLLRCPSGANQLNHLAPEGRRSLPPWKRGAVSISA